VLAASRKRQRGPEELGPDARVALLEQQLKAAEVDLEAARIRARSEVERVTISLRAAEAQVGAVHRQLEFMAAEEERARNALHARELDFLREKSALEATAAQLRGELRASARAPAGGAGAPAAGPAAAVEAAQAEARRAAAQREAALGREAGLLKEQAAALTATLSTERLQHSAQVAALQQQLRDAAAAAAAAAAASAAAAAGSRLAAGSDGGGGGGGDGAADVAGGVADGASGGASDGAVRRELADSLRRERALVAQVLSCCVISPSVSASASPCVSSSASASASPCVSSSVSASVLSPCVSFPVSASASRSAPPRTNPLYPTLSLSLSLSL
jgi:hypothetical protein